MRNCLHSDLLLLGLHSMGAAVCATQHQSLDVRKIAHHFDYTHYVASLFLPKQQREILWALLALMAELHHAVIVAREPLAGHMRLAWWREQLQSGFMRGHPLLVVLQGYELSKIHLHALVDGYGLLLETDTVEGMDGLFRLGAGLYAPLYRMMCPNVPDSLLVRFAQVDGAVQLLLKSHEWLKIGKVILPSMSMDQHGYTLDMLKQGGLSTVQLQHISHMVWEEVFLHMPEPSTSAYPRFLVVMHDVLDRMKIRVRTFPLLGWQAQREQRLQLLSLKIMAAQILRFFK
jgi:hypothetical protein